MRTLTLTALLCLAIPAAAGAQSVARGKYLAERASMCVDCHSPRDDKGQFVPGKTLRGNPLDIHPTHPMPWADVAPPIAGLPAGYSFDQVVTFLQTGKRPDGSMPRPPMPPYRFNHADATALAAYLRSLK